MSNLTWLTIADYRQYVDASLNLPTLSLQQPAQDAYIFDVLTILPDQMLTDIKAIIDAATAYNNATAYTTGQKVVYNYAYYQSISGSTGVLPTDATKWTPVRPQLMDAWQNSIKPFMVYSAYYRFLNWHGANVTQFGVRQNQEPTSNEITDKRRGELMADINSKKNVYQLRLNRAMSDASYTFDTIVYSLDVLDSPNPGRRVKIWGAGGMRGSNNLMRPCGCSHDCNCH
jgi:hypothetical protein